MFSSAMLVQPGTISKEFFLLPIPFHPFFLKRNQPLRTRLVSILRNQLVCCTLFSLPLNEKRAQAHGREKKSNQPFHPYMELLFAPVSIMDELMFEFIICS